MADKPILFSGPMVRAILDGRKTQTRRVLKPVKGLTLGELQDDGEREGNMIRCARHQVQEPPYATGDRLWVREAHALLPRTAYRGSVGTGTIQQIEHPTDGYTAAVFREGFDRSGSQPWRPSIFMPRWASRLTLIASDVCVQRLQDISEDYAWAEGCVKGDPDHMGGFFPAEEPDPSGIGHRGWDNARDWYADLWDGLNAKRGFGWDANPWVCAVTFTAHQRNIDQLEAA